MALRLSISTPVIRSPSPQSTVLAHQRPAGAQLDTGSRSIGSARCSVLRNSTELKQKWARVPVRSSLETAGLTAAVGQVSEVNKDTFWPIVKAAGEKVVVLDMYTQWCGPCKIMAPRFQELSEKLLDVVFLKLDCNQENRPLAKELGIRVVPTFKILKDGKVVKEVTGAKFDDLVLAIETVKSSDASTHHPSSSVHNNT